MVLLRMLGSHLAPSDEGAGERSETEGEKKVAFTCSFTTSLPPSRAKPCHLPRQREARIVETPTFVKEPLFYREAWAFKFIIKLIIFTLILAFNNMSDNYNLT